MSETSCTLIPLDDRLRWQAALQGIPHAFGHTWEFCAAMQLSSGLPTYLFVLSDQGGTSVVCPLSERSFDGHTDIVTPYGFSGFVSSKPVPDFPRHWQHFVTSRGYVCGYIGLNPLLDNVSPVFSGDVFTYNTLFVFDLTKEIPELFDSVSDNRKRQIRNFDRSSLSCSMDKMVLKRFLLDHFYTFFRGKEAPLLYNFTAETLQGLLENDNVLLIGVLKEGVVEAVSVFAHTRYGADYLFNVSLPEGRQHTTPLIWQAVAHYKKLRVPFLNLGGGVQEGDPIALYKERFHAGKFPLQCLKQVYNPGLYQDLCTAKGVDPENRAQYFPAYRSPQ